MILEICTGSYDSVVAACQGGANRIELCSALDEGGLTPSYGLLRASLSLCKRHGVQVHVLIRPRGGDFLYTPDEIELMIADLQFVHQLGVDGAVIGALNKEGDINQSACKQFIAAAEGLPLTFHRAFDVCRFPFVALEQLQQIGFQRILTSGQAANALEGVSLLRELCQMKSPHPIIMPGSGVTPQNIRSIIAQTGATEIHASAKAPISSGMNFRKKGVEMGDPKRDEYLRWETDASLVQQLKAQMESI